MTNDNTNNSHASGHNNVLLTAGSVADQPLSMVAAVLPSTPPVGTRNDDPMVLPSFLPLLAAATAIETTKSNHVEESENTTKVQRKPKEQPEFDKNTSRRLNRYINVCYCLLHDPPTERNIKKE